MPKELHRAARLSRRWALSASAFLAAACDGRQFTRARDLGLHYIAKEGLKAEAEQNNCDRGSYPIENLESIGRYGCGWN
jgi:hypothetical protein